MNREDAISRSEAIKVLEYVLTIDADSGLYKYRTVIKDLLTAIYNTQKKAIEDLPSVSTEKTGRWEWVQYDSNPNIGNWHCSECNRIVCGAITAANPVYSYKYCPNCGAKMGVEANEHS